MSLILARLFELAMHAPDRVALQGEQGSLTYHALYLAVQELSDFLKRHKIRRLGLLAENCFEWIIADLAAMHADAVLVPIPKFFSSAQCRYVIGLTGIEHVLLDADTVVGIEVLAKTQTPIRLMLATLTTAISESASQIDTRTCKITFTSGTTGEPKGVCLSADALCATTSALAERMTQGEHAGDISGQLQKHFVLLPLSLLLENIAGVYVPILLGRTILVNRGTSIGLIGSSQLEIGTLIQALNQNQPNSLIVMPQILKGLIAAHRQGKTLPESLKLIAVGGASCPLSLLQDALSAGIPVYEGYGLSECASVVALNAPMENQIGSVGKALSHLEVKVENERIWVRGLLALGYLQREGYQALPQTVEGWFDTGDLGSMDDRGFLHITGRAKHLLISSFGRNISPEWIETKLSGTPDIGQLVVIGDARPFCAALIVASAVSNTGAICEHIKSSNAELPDYAHVKRFALLSNSFSIANGLLTDNGRARRAEINHRYQSMIDAIYQDDSRISSTQLGTIYDVL